MKLKSLFPLTAIMLLCATMMSCGNDDPVRPDDDDPETVHVESVTIDEVGSDLSLEVNTSRQLTVTVLPENADDKSVTWSSSTPSAATVESGLVTALAEGITIITATSVDNGEITATVIVTVTETAPYINILDEITDPVFLAYCNYCMENADWDADNDGELSREEAAAVTEINANGYFAAGWRPNGEKIASLEGIEYFTGLVHLECWMNDISEIDVSKNTALEYFRCDQNALTALDVSANTALVNLYCYINSITEIDLSANTALEVLQCYSNLFETLDVSRNTLLTRLFCDNNRLTELDLATNTALVELYCNNNLLETLDVAANTELKALYCYVNQLTELDLAVNTKLELLSCYDNNLSELNLATNTALKRLLCSGNEISALNISANTAMDQFECKNNLLTTLDITKNRALVKFDCSGNPGNESLKFPVKAWFDNTTIPKASPTGGAPYSFTQGSWSYDGKTIAIDYQKQ